MVKGVVSGKLLRPNVFKPTNIGSVSPKSWGRVLDDGTISFPDQESAVKYAIETCQKSLKSDKQFERAVGIEGKRVVYRLNGDANSVGEPPCSAEILVHSHPDTYDKGCTTALSGGDYASFVSDPKMTTMYAVNSKGEYYKMTKKPGYDYSQHDFSSTFGDFNTCMNRTLYGHSGVPAEQRECLEKCIESKDLVKFYSDFYPKYIEPLTNGMKDISKATVDKTHEFWVKFADKFGVKIDTNFSNFTKS